MTIEIERERESVQALNHDEQVYMATLVLEGWTFGIKQFEGGPRKWWALPPGGGLGAHTFAPTLFSLLGYIERKRHDRS